MTVDVDTKARAGATFQALCAAVADHVALHADGVTNAEVAASLNLESSYQGGHRNYLTHSILSRLVEQGRLTRSKEGRNVRYRASNP